MKPKRIILHHSLTKDGATVSWQAIRKYHTDPNGEYKFKDIGYHFGIELVNAEYEILIGRQLDQQGAHTKGANEDSIGICVVGNFDVGEVPEAAYQKLLALVRSLMVVLMIPIIAVRCHRDFATKTCPGAKFPLQRLLKDLAGRTPLNT